MFTGSPSTLGGGVDVCSTLCLSSLSRLPLGMASAPPKPSKAGMEDKVLHLEPAPAPKAETVGHEGKQA